MPYEVIPGCHAFAAHQRHEPHTHELERPRKHAWASRRAYMSTRYQIYLRGGRIDLASAVHDAVETSRPLIEERGHQIILRLPPKPVYVHGDRDRLAQVFSNLLNNSAKYTGPGGHIWLTVEQHGSDAVI